MDVVFEGALSRSWGMADVLRGVMGVENQRYGILRISSPGSNVSGRLAIAESKFIVGGLLSDGTEGGYGAVRRLLMASDGNFAYLDTGGKKPQDFDQGLYISLSRMSEIWPNLPEDPNELFDEKALLDKVFGGDGKAPPDPSSGQIPIIQPEPVKNPERPTRASLVKAMQEAANSGNQPGQAVQKQTWQTMVKPLLSNSLVDGAQTLPGNYADLDDTAAHERQSLTKLRAVEGVPEESRFKKLIKDSIGGNAVLVWIILIVALAAVAIFIVYAFLNQRN